MKFFARRSHFAADIETRSLQRRDEAGHLLIRRRDVNGRPMNLHMGQNENVILIFKN